MTVPGSLADRAADAIARASADTGADVFAHARNLDSGDDLGVRENSPVVLASVFKVLVLTEYVRQVTSGRLDPTKRMLVRAGTGALGPTGLSVFTDDTDWSLRDVATSMISVSDNAAADLLTDMVGRERVNQTMAALGLSETVLSQDCTEVFDLMAQELGAADALEAFRTLHDDPSRWHGLSACDPLRTNRSTPREATRLLELLWTDQAGEPAACAEARRIMGLQVWSHRLSSGFPFEHVTISGKTGTIGCVRNEVGVVEFPGGPRFAVAVFVRSHRFEDRQPQIDALIGTVGATLVSALRGS